MGNDQFDIIMSIKRRFFTGEDSCYEEYLLTKCPVYKDIFIGGMKCLKCPRFIKLHEMYDGDDDYEDYVICK